MEFKLIVHITNTWTWEICLPHVSLILYHVEQPVELCPYGLNHSVMEASLVLKPMVGKASQSPAVVLSCSECFPHKYIHQFVRFHFNPYQWLHVMVISDSAQIDPMVL